MFVNEWYGIVSFFSVFFLGMTSLMYTTCVGVRRSRCKVIKCCDCILCLREIMTKEEMIVDGIITHNEGEQRLREKEIELKLTQTKVQDNIEEPNYRYIKNRLFDDLRNLDSITSEIGYEVQSHRELVTDTLFKSKENCDIKNHENNV